MLPIFLKFQQHLETIGLSTAAIAGIVIGVILVVVAVIGGVLYFMKRRSQKRPGGTGYLR